MEDRIRLLQGSLCAPFLKAGLAGQLDLVVSNPPYIADSEFPSLQPEVRDHDPRAALSGGKDGLHVMRRLVKETPALLRQNGWLLVEIGAGQAEKVGDLLSRTGVWRKVETFRDLAKIERAVAAQKAFSAGSETAG
jgi:release factor glutamine methyltransferase